MKTMILLLCTFLPILSMHAQEEETFTEQHELQVEQQRIREEAVPEDDAQWQLASQYRRHPLRLNTATASDLQELQMLHPWQIRNFLLYRTTFGKLLSMYELQAVPGWDAETILRIKPFVSIRETEATDRPFFKRFSGGEGNLIIRTGKLFSAGDPSSYVRYRYKFNKQLQWGFTAEKDAGEPLFGAAQKGGFDFYSFHLFARRAGPLRVLALGDFQVNMGQGLIQWQGMNYAFGSVLAAKKHSEVLQPYSSAGEFNFHRGAGGTVGNGSLQLTTFISYRKQSAALHTDSAGTYFNNFSVSGYHRTTAEQAGKGAVRLLTAGACLQWRQKNWQLGLNAVQYHAAVPFRPPAALYRLFAIEGQRWSNASIDYGITIRNLHAFGELAIDQERQLAFTTGICCSLLPGMQCAFSYRYFSKAYQSLFSSAVSQGAAPSNEEGIAIKLEWQLHRRWKLQAGADLFRFPWLRYRVDAPANGYEHLLMLLHQPSKKISWQFRYQLSQKPLNQSDSQAIKFPGWQKRRQWRVQWSYSMNERFTLKQRTDYLQFSTKGQGEETGISLWLDAGYKPGRRWMVNGRLHLYETGSYQSRIYSYERDLLYSYAMPAFAGNAIRAYVLLRYKIFPDKPGKSRKWNPECWIKYACSLRGSGEIMRGEEEEVIPRTELRVQLLVTFH